MVGGGGVERLYNVILFYYIIFCLYYIVGSGSGSGSGSNINDEAWRSAVCGDG